MSITGLLARVGGLEDPFKDFRNFLHHIFTEVFGFDMPAEIQYDIADFMQHLPKSADGISRGQAQAMRGAGKTYIACALALWFLYLDADLKILIVAAIDRKAKDIVDLCRSIISGTELLRHLAPKLAKDGDVRKDQKDNLFGFNVGAITRPAKELSLQGYPIFGALNSVHPDIIISDDIETPENALTVGKRVRLLNKAFEYESLINPGGLIIHLGTPQSEDSVYGKLEKVGYPIRRWPAVAPALDDVTSVANVSPWIIDKVRNGEWRPGSPTYPERFGIEALTIKQGIYGASMYALQMLLDTTLADKDRYPLKLKDLIVMDLHAEMAPENVIWGTVNKLDYIDPQGMPGDAYYGPAARSEKYAPYTTGVMFIDPKGSGADGVGYGVCKVLNGIIYGVDAGQVAAGKGNDGTSEAAMTKLAKIALKHKIKKVVVERNFGDGMYTKLLSPIMAKINGPTEITEYSSKGQKELRILAVLEPLLEVHKLVFSVQMAGNDILMYQFSRLRREAGCLQHDDVIEALAMACAQLVPMVQLDPEKQIAAAAEAERTALVKEFRKGMHSFDFPTGVPQHTGVSNKGWSSRVSRRWGRRS